MWNNTILFLNRWAARSTMLSLVAMVILISLQIVSRSIFSTSFAWPEEVARFLLIWVVFLGAGFAFQSNAHISIDVFVERLPEKLKKASQVLVVILCCTFLAFLIVQGLKLSSKTMIQTSPGLGIPMGYVYLIIPISGFLQILNLIDVTIKIFKGGEKPEGV